MNLIFISLDLVVPRKRNTDKSTVHTLFRFSPYHKYYDHPPNAPLGPEAGVSLLLFYGCVAGKEAGWDFQTSGVLNRKHCDGHVDGSP